ncbi:hypothetical protein G6F31_012702 [Rhizopus arrhizus]|nr:hypothetical protein G6F31_012702 [Rhizopus arrhizus]
MAGPLRPWSRAGRAGQGAGAGPAEAAPVPRNLRLRPARGRYSPALRRGRPGWPALVGPARRLPYRSAGPGQGADGQEHRHRAGRREGRLLRQDPAGQW